MTEREEISRLPGETSRGKPKEITLVRNEDGELEIHTLNRDGGITATHRFSESAFKQFFGGILEETADPIRLVPSDRKKRIELAMDLLEELDEEDIEFINQRLHGKQIETPESRETVKLDVLQHMRKIDPPGEEKGFLSREFIKNSPYNGSHARSWVNNLCQAGYLYKIDADHPDGRIEYEYALTEKAENYLDYMEEQGSVSS